MPIRPATRPDLPALGRLGASLMRAHAAFDRHRFLAVDDQAAAEAGYAAFLGTQLAEPDVVVLVAESDAGIDGYVYAGIEPLSWKELRGPAGFIHDLVVDERARRSGVATALLKAAIAWLAAHGAPRVMLWTASGNDAARRLFERAGFRETMREMTLELDSVQSSKFKVQSE